MKKYGSLLLGISYVCVAITILFTYIQLISGQIGKNAGVFIMILLVIPFVTLVYLSATLREDEEKIQNEQDNNNSIGIGDAKEFQWIVSKYDLSSREMDVAWLLYRGYTNRQIAEELYVAETTVKKHSTHIYEKTQVSGRKEFKEKVRLDYEKS